MNPTIDLLNKRCSTRVFTADPITEEERGAIFNAAFRAPTGGNMMLYSILDIQDQAIKDRLAVTCDDQPFIAKAPLVLVFVADYQKWIDLFEFSHVERVDVEQHRLDSGLGDMMLACSDALIAAQNAVVAAESLGIGSCYIGDILENGEIHADLLGLPRYTLPVAMVVFGRPAAPIEPRPRQSDHVVHTNTYRSLSPEELAQVSADLAAEYAPRGNKPGIENYPQSVYARKHASDFMREMNRSVAWWIDRWEGKG